MKMQHVSILRRSGGRTARFVRIADAVGETSTKLAGKSHRPGLYQCNPCGEPLTVRSGECNGTRSISRFGHGRLRFI